MDTDDTDSGEGCEGLRGDASPGGRGDLRISDSRRGMSGEERTAETVSLVPVYIRGKRYEVPASLTIQKAMEYAGYQLVRGCGCRGGVCGACGTVYRFPDSYRVEVGLACQTVVQPNMYLTQIPLPREQGDVRSGGIVPDRRAGRQALSGALQVRGVQYLHALLPDGDRRDGSHRPGPPG